MDNIPNKTDGVDTLADSEFNSHKNELQTLVTESGQTLAIGTTDQLRKAISIFGRALYAQDSSGAANTLTLSRPTALTDTSAYYNGLTIIFDTPNANTGATTATFNGLASKKVLRPDDTDLVVGDILPGVTYTLVYNTALDSAAGAFELKEIGAKLWDKQTVTHNMTVDDNYTLTAEQDKFGKIIITDTNPFLTVPKNIIVSNKQKDFIVFNDTLQTLTFKTSSGSGIAVTAGAKIWLLCDGTDVIESVDSASADTRLNTADEKYAGQVAGEEILNSNAGELIKSQCRAYVNFDGTTGAIRDSFNVASVVRNSIGNYTITTEGGITTDATTVSDCSASTSFAFTSHSNMSGVDTVFLLTKDGDAQTDRGIVSLVVFGGQA